LCRWQLRDALRAAREACGLTRQDAVDVLEWSVAKLARIEAGQVGVSLPDLRAMLSLYEVGQPEADVLAAMARAARTRPWHARYQVAAAVPGLGQYLDAEGSAARVCGHWASAVPDLLQTPDYARAFLRETGQGRAGELVELLLARQQRLLSHGDGPQLSYIVDEGVLLRFPSAAVMRGQRRRLAALAGHPRISVRVVPYASGAWPPPQAAYSVIEVPGGTLDGVYLETARGSVIHLAGPDQTERYRRYFDAAQAKSAALPPYPHVSRLRLPAEAKCVLNGPRKKE